MSTFTRLLPALILLVASGCGDSGTGEAASSPVPAADASRPTSQKSPEGPTDDEPAKGSKKGGDGARDQRGGDAKGDGGDSGAEADSGDGSDQSDSEESHAGDGRSEDETSRSRQAGPSTLEVSGAPFETLAFDEVECMGEGTDLLVQTQSTDDPAVVVTVLFGDGDAVQATAQTDPDSDDSTIWSDDDADSLARTVTRDGDAVTLDEAELSSFDDGKAITLSGTLTCTST